MNKKRQQLIDSFVRNPTTYTIQVRDNSMLPKELKSKKELSFTVRPPTIHVLSLAASVLSEIPEELLPEGDEMNFDDALKYQDQIVRVLCVYFHEGTDFPEWWPAFILKNVSTVDLLKIMQETAVKCSPGFFLSCFQVAAQSNPMMMTGTRNTTEDSTPIGS